MNADRDERTHEIIGAAMEVHNSLGAGFLEAVYQEALAIELTERSVPFQREVGLLVNYKGRPLRTSYKADFICFGTILVELKVASQLTRIDEAQVVNYLKATDFELGLLFNFGGPRLDFRRLILSQNNLRKSVSSAVPPFPIEHEELSRVE
ncbi:MAG: GxxExxY protein [Planctomycetes bacterium]|nr:GxxExxY protein [Planctomycetota bacterium]MBI3833585.1 GxxExxY protein [Planctomycetota bacterium]